MNITDARGENVVNPPPVLPEKIYLPPMHIKLGLVKNFVKGMDKLVMDSNMWGISSQM